MNTGKFWEESSNFHFFIYYIPRLCIFFEREVPTMQLESLKQSQLFFTTALGCLHMYVYEQPLQNSCEGTCKHKNATEIRTWPDQRSNNKLATQFLNFSIHMAFIDSILYLSTQLIKLPYQSYHISISLQDLAKMRKVLLFTLKSNCIYSTCQVG